MFLPYHIKVVGVAVDLHTLEPAARRIKSHDMVLRAGSDSCLKATNPRDTSSLLKHGVSGNTRLRGLGGGFIGCCTSPYLWPAQPKETMGCRVVWD